MGPEQHRSLPACSKRLYRRTVMAMDLGVVAGRLDWLEFDPAEGRVLVLEDAGAVSDAIPVAARWGWVARRAEDAARHGHSADVLIDENPEDTSKWGLFWDSGGLPLLATPMYAIAAYLRALEFGIQCYVDKEPLESTSFVVHKEQSSTLQLCHDAGLELRLPPMVAAGDVDYGTPGSCVAPASRSDRLSSPPPLSATIDSASLLPSPLHDVLACVCSSGSYLHCLPPPAPVIITVLKKSVVPPLRVPLNSC